MHAPASAPEFATVPPKGLFGLPAAGGINMNFPATSCVGVIENNAPGLKSTAKLGDDPDIAHPALHGDPTRVLSKTLMVYEGPPSGTVVTAKLDVRVPLAVIWQFRLGFAKKSVPAVTATEHVLAGPNCPGPGAFPNPPPVIVIGPPVVP